jgi:hypothetical protein
MVVTTCIEKRKKAASHDKKGLILDQPFLQGKAIEHGNIDQFVHVFVDDQIYSGG